MKDAFRNKKITLGLATVGLVFAIIIVSSFWPFILDPTRIMTTEFLTDELIITAIVLSVTVAMMFVAQASNAQNPDSEIAKARVEFKASIARIKNHSWLYQWVRKRLQPNDRREIAEREMGKLLVPMEVFDLSENEIRTLVKPCEIDGKFYGPYDIKKIETIIATKKRISKIRFVSPNYYTSVSSLQSDKTLSEIAKNENVKKIASLVFQLSLRILLTWFAASIIGSLVRDLAQQGGSSAQAWMRFLSRAFAFGSSCFLGFMMGCKMNDTDAFYIGKRVEVHTLYLEDKTFEPVDESKEAFKQRVMEETRLLGKPEEDEGNG